MLLFHLVTGKFPVEATSVAGIGQAHEDGERMLLLRDERPRLPRAFVEVVERALSKTASERYKTAGLMEQALTVSDRPRLRLFSVVSSVAVTAAAVVALSFVTSGAFRVFLGVPDQFETGGLDLQWGIQPMVPVLFYWGFLLFVLATLAGLAMLSRSAVSRASPRWRRLFETAGIAGGADTVAVSGFLFGSLAWFAVTWSQSTLFLALVVFVFSWVLGFPMLVSWTLDASGVPQAKQSSGTPIARRVIEMVQSPVASPVLRAAVVFSLASVCWLGIIWSQADVFRALAALNEAPVEAANESLLFASLSDAGQRSNVQAYSYLSFALGFAIWHVKRLERVESAADPVQLMRWSLVVLFSLTLVLIVLPYRVTWEDYERAEYDGVRASILAATDQEYYLFWFLSEIGVTLAGLHG